MLTTGTIKPTRIGIAEDHLILRETIQKMLNKEDRFEIIVAVGNGADLINELRHKQVDLVILDLHMPIMNGRETLELINKLYPNIKTLILSMNDDPMRLKKYFQLGAKGFLSKECQYSELLTALDTIADGRVYLNSAASHAAYKQKNIIKSGRNKNVIDEPLTSRELEILKLVCLEKTNKEIAIELDLSFRTIENHTLHIRKKTGAANGAGLLIYALKNNIISI